MLMPCRAASGVESNGAAPTFYCHVKLLQQQEVMVIQLTGEQSLSTLGHLTLPSYLAASLEKYQQT